jgi:hypothetical protein
MFYFIQNIQNTVKLLIVILHKPAVVDYIMLNFGEFLFISNFVWRAFIKKEQPSML